MSRRDEGIADMDWAPFPGGFNPNVQATYDITDLKYVLEHETFAEIQDSEILSLTVWKNDPTNMELNTKVGFRKLSFEFEIGHATFAVTPSLELCLVIWNADNTHLYMSDLEGRVIKSGHLPDLPIGWCWQTAKSLDINTLELPTYNEHLTEFGPSLVCFLH